MKKFLILMLVLCLASAANAVVVSTTQGYYYEMEVSATSSTIDVGDTVTVEISAGTDSTGTSAMLGTILNISAASSATVATISNSGDWSVAPVPTTTASGGGYNVNVSGTPLTTGIPTGNSIYTVTFVAVAGNVTIDATGGNWDGFTAAVGIDDGQYEYGAIYGLPYAQVTVVPEPMTIALLGLGGLFLRRRK